LVQVDQADHCPVLVSQVRDCVPQLPHAIVAGPVHIWPGHSAGHWQLARQVRLPPLPQACVAPEAQAPWFMQADQADHWPVLPSQVRVCVPQFSQGWVGEPMHIWPRQAPLQWQLPPQVSVPPEPQARV
jgi:hypothetical protein